MSMHRIFLLLFGAFLGFEASAQTLPLVKVLTTGGTIASRYDPVQKGFVPALSGEQLFEAIPEAKAIARVDFEAVSNIGSSDMTPEIWRKLSARANELLAQAEVAGVVVTHGTDTMEETAYFLDLT